MLLDDASIGQLLVCPNCGQTVAARPPLPATPVAPVREVQTNVRQSAALGGWICFIVAVIALFVPFPTWFVYLPLFFVSFILAIVAMTQGKVLNGLLLLLANIIGFPIFFVLALFLGIATWTGIGIAAQKAQANHEALLLTNTPAITNASAVSQVETSSTNNDAVPPGAASSVPATDKIEAAFGRELGAYYDPSFAAGTSTLTDGTPLYEFNPASGFRSFDHYYVLITPKTHRIYSIWATESLNNMEMAKKEQAVVMEMLKEKYGAPSAPGLADIMASVQQIDQGSRYVLTRIDDNADVTLSIRYDDNDIEKIAEQERIADQIQKTDKTGL